MGEWGAYIVLMYDYNSSSETKWGDRYKRHTIHNYCTQYLMTSSLSMTLAVLTRGKAW